MSDSNVNLFPIRKFNTANFKSSKMQIMHFQMSRISTAQFCALSGSKIFTISQHKIVFTILLNGSLFQITSVTQNSITNRYTPDRTIHLVSLYIQSPILLIQTFILPISKLTPYEIRNLSTTCGRLSQTQPIYLWKNLSNCKNNRT